MLLLIRWLLLTVTAHPHGEAFLESAVLAAVAVVLVHVAVLVEPAAVALVFSHGPLEESLAALATEISF